MASFMKFIRKSSQPDYSNIQFHEEIGEGSFGTVNRVTFKKPFKGYVEAAAKSVRGMRKGEVDIMQKLKHPNIVTWLGFYSKGPMNLILMEYAQNGSLHKYLYDMSKPLPESLKRKWAKESALAIEYLHDHKWLHRDIKPNNCLLFENNTLKLCDFGLAREIDNTFTLSSAKGTYQYMAPEIINANGSFSIYTDIYAYGMLLLAIYTRQTPFKGKEHRFVVFNVANGTLQPDIPKEVPEDIANVMKQCWEREPRKRPTMKSILECGVLCEWTVQMQIKPQVEEIHRTALHPSGDMVVATVKKQVYLLDSNGKVKRSLESPDTRRIWSEYINAVSISPQGHVYIVEKRSHLIREFDESGTFLNSFSILTDGEDPSTHVDPLDATIDRDGNLLVIDAIRDVITIHTCPGGEMIDHIKINVKWDHRCISMRCIVNSKNQILLHYNSPYSSVYSNVVAIDYSGNELYSFTPPKTDENLNVQSDRLVNTRQGEDVNEEWVHACGIVCDSKDNIIVATIIADTLNTVTGTCSLQNNTGHIHVYIDPGIRIYDVHNPTVTLLKYIAKGLYMPYDLSMSQDGSSIVVAIMTNQY